MHNPGLQFKYILKSHNCIVLDEEMQKFNFWNLCNPVLWNNKICFSKFSWYQCVAKNSYFGEAQTQKQFADM